MELTREQLQEATIAEVMAHDQALRQSRDEYKAKCEAYHDGMNKQDDYIKELRGQLAQALKERDEYQAKCEAYAERLEITHVYDMEGRRVEIPREKWDKQIDGISCRDETIRLQDEWIDKNKPNIKSLQNQIAEVTAERDEWKKLHLESCSESTERRRTRDEYMTKWLESKAQLAQATARVKELELSLGTELARWDVKCRDIQAERDRWYGQAQDRAITINTLQQRITELEGALKELYGQVDQAREGFGIYKQSPSMDQAMKEAQHALEGT